ncbi:MAG: hypothetical protein JWM90_1562 [Thermoleophilia bacterium]|nr:hypothetical protein [Thermoleophilia bacterium]
MNKRNLILVVLLVAAAVAILPLAQAAPGGASGQVPVRAADQLRAAMDRTNAPFSSSARDTIRDVLPTERGLDGDPPLRSDLASAAAARVLLASGSSQIVVVPARGSDICFRISKGADSRTMGCIADLSATGVLVTMRAAEGRLPDEVAGLAASDVESVTVVTRTGELIDVPVVNNAFFWTAPENSVRVEKVLTVRNGVTTEEISPELLRPTDF